MLLFYGEFLSDTESNILSFPFYFTFKWEKFAQGVKGRIEFSREINHIGIREVRKAETAGDVEEQKACPRRAHVGRIQKTCQ